MPIFSLFVLALYVFLQSVPAFGWFSVDAKFTAFVGMVFVVTIIIETFFWARAHPGTWFKHQ